MRRVLVLACLTIVTVVLLANLATVDGFNLNERRWPSPTTTFNVDISGADGLWNSAFERAMFLWSDVTVFDLRIFRETFEDPCDGLPTPTSLGDFQNGVAFTSDICGNAFGESTLAVATSWSDDGTTIQSNIHFNNKWTWDVYDGPHGVFPFTNIYDFRRVAVHELGHTIGLGHENEVPAIMRSVVTRGSSVVLPTADDIAGVAALYGLLPSTPAQVSPANGATGVSLTPSLTWLTSIDAEFYDVYFGTSSSPPFVSSFPPFAQSAFTTYSPGTLASNTTYYWRIVARNAFGSSPSSTLHFTTADLRPAQPTLLNPTDRQTEISLTPTLSWSAASDAASYDVYFGTTMNPPFVQNTTGTSFNPGTLNPDQTYYWWVAARNAFGTTTSQFQFVFTTLRQTDLAANTSHVFPQMVDGVVGDGTAWVSFLLATNPGSAGTTCTFTPKGGLDASRLVQSGDFFLGASGASTLVITNSTEALAVGYATLNCTQPVTAQLTYLNLAGPTITSMATVTSSDSARTAQLQFLNFSGFRTAFAIANDGAVSVSCEVTVSHEKTMGPLGKVRIVQGTAVVVVEPKTNLARFADEIVSLDPSVATGIVEIECSRSAHSVGLLFNGSSFSTAPTTILDQADSTANEFHVFPQMVDGDGGDGTTWLSFLIATNPDTDGTTCTFTPRGGLNASRLAQPSDFFLGPGGSSTLILTNSTEALAVGYATLNCTKPVTAQLTYLSRVGPTITSMATVTSSDSARSAQLQFLNFSGFRTAFAIANDGAVSVSCEVTVSHEKIMGPLGKVRVVQGTAVVVVEPKTNLARFADEIVSLDPSVATGIVEIECSGSVHAVGLLFNGSSFSTAPVTILVPGGPPAENISTTLCPSTPSPGTEVIAVVAFPDGILTEPGGLFLPEGTLFGSTTSNIEDLSFGSDSVSAKLAIESAFCPEQGVTGKIRCDYVCSRRVDGESSSVASGCVFRSA